MSHYLTLLRQRPNYRFLWLAQVISLMGDWFNAIAVVLIINRYVDINPAIAIAVTIIARSLPPFLLGPLAGVIADRFNRKNILLFTDFSRAVIVLGFLLVRGAEQVWLVYVLLVLQFSISAFFEPTRAAILPTLVQDNELLTANTLASATWSAVLATGAAIGGFFAASFGVSAALVIDALTFLLSAVLVLQIKMPAEAHTIPTDTSGWQDLIDGFRYVIGHPNIVLVTLVKAMGQIGNVDVLIAVFAEQIFRLGEGGALTLGLLFSFSGIGAVLGPIIADQFITQRVAPLKWAIVVGFLLVPLGWFVWGISPTLTILLGGSVLRAMGGSINWTYSNVLIQMQVPDRYLGRVFAFDFGLFTIAFSAAAWVAGYAIDELAIDPRHLSLNYAALSLIPLAIWLLSTLFLGRPSPHAETVSHSSAGDR